MEREKEKEGNKDGGEDIGERHILSEVIFEWTLSSSYCKQCNNKLGSVPISLESSNLI